MFGIGSLEPADDVEHPQFPVGKIWAANGGFFHIFAIYANVYGMEHGPCSSLIYL